MTDNNVREHEVHGLPRPTIWPFAMAAGIALIAWGLVTNAFIAGSGVIVFGVSLVGWIRELIGDTVARESHHDTVSDASAGGTHDA